MKSYIKSGRTFSAFVVILLSLITLTGCKSEDNIVNPQEEHFEAEGVVLQSSGIKIASIFRGVTTDTIKVPVGEYPDHIDVKFYNANQAVINPPSDPDKKLAYSIADTTVVTLWQHADEAGGYEIHLRGKKPGITTMELFIKHGEHSDFRSGNFTIRVDSAYNVTTDKINYIRQNTAR